MDPKVAWAAGIIEGEGCFTLHTNNIYLEIDMCDKDVIDRLKDIFPTGTVRGPYFHKKRPNNKPRWRFDAFGTRCLPIIEAILPLLGERRTTKVKEILASCGA